MERMSTTTTASKEKKMSAGAEEAKRTVLAFFKAFDDGDFQRTDELLASSLVAYIPGNPNALDKNAFSQFGKMFKSAFPDGIQEFDSVLADGDNVVTVGEFRGTRTGELQAMKPTGKQVRMRISHIDKVANGKIVEHRGFADMMGMMQQLGVS